MQQNKAITNTNDEVFEQVNHKLKQDFLDNQSANSTNWKACIPIDLEYCTNKLKLFQALLTTKLNTAGQKQAFDKATLRPPAFPLTKRVGRPRHNWTLKTLELYWKNIGQG